MKICLVLLVIIFVIILMKLFSWSITSLEDYIDKILNNNFEQKQLLREKTYLEMYEDDVENILMIATYDIDIENDEKLIQKTRKNLNKMKIILLEYTVEERLKRFIIYFYYPLQLFISSRLFDIFVQMNRSLDEIILLFSFYTVIFTIPVALLIHYNKNLRYQRIIENLLENEFKDLDNNIDILDKIKNFDIYKRIILKNSISSYFSNRVQIIKQKCLILILILFIFINIGCYIVYNYSLSFF